MISHGRVTFIASIRLHRQQRGLWSVSAWLGISLAGPSTSTSVGGSGNDDHPILDGASPDVRRDGHLGILEVAVRLVPGLEDDPP